MKIHFRSATSQIYEVLKNEGFGEGTDSDHQPVPNIHNKLKNIYVGLLLHLPHAAAILYCLMTSDPWKNT